MKRVTFYMHEKKRSKCQAGVDQRSGIWSTLWFSNVSLPEKILEKVMQNES
jgi:hypothetical protein